MEEPTSNEPAPQETDWRATVPEPLRDFTVVKEAKDPDSAYKNLAESLRYADKLRGSSLRIPSEEAGPEDLQKFNEKVLKHSPNLMLKPDQDNPEVMDSFYNSIGRPESHDGYEVPEFDGDVNNDRINRFKEVAHEVGMSNAQFKKAVGAIVGEDLNAHKQAQMAEEQALTELKTEWGAGYENQYNKAEFIRKEFFEGVIPEGKMPVEIVKRFNSLAKQLGSEGGSLTARIPDNQGGGLTRDEALSRANEIRNTDAYKGGDPVALKKHSDYFKVAYPE